MSLVPNPSLIKPKLAKLNEDYPKIKTIQNVSEIDGLMNYMVSVLNIKAANEDEVSELEKQMILVLDLIRSKFGNLTIKEVEEAFKMYVSKELNIKVFRLLDCVSVGEILNQYVNFRNESLRVYDHKKQQFQNRLPEMTEEAKEEIVKNGINKRFLDYKSSGELEDPTEYIFDFLLEKGIIKNSTTPKLVQYYQDKLQQAKIEIQKELEDSMISPDDVVRKTAKIEYEDFVKVGSNKTMLRAKKIVLGEYFEKQKQLGKTIIFEV